MDLIIKPTELCNFKCTFCSSTNITDNKNATLSVDQIFQFLERFPDTKTIIVNGGDPLMMSPAYYWKIIDWLDLHEYDTSVSFTTNLWPFYKNPEKWADLFNHERMGITTSFQYGGGRLKGDLTEFSEELQGDRAWPNDAGMSSYRLGDFFWGNLHWRDRLELVCTHRDSLAADYFRTHASHSVHPRHRISKRRRRDRSPGSVSSPQLLKLLLATGH